MYWFSEGNSSPRGCEFESRRRKQIGPLSTFICRTFVLLFAVWKMKKRPRKWPIEPLAAAIVAEYRWLVEYISLGLLLLLLLFLLNILLDCRNNFENISQRNETLIRRVISTHSRVIIHSKNETQEVRPQRRKCISINALSKLLF